MYKLLIIFDEKLKILYTNH